MASPFAKYQSEQVQQLAPGFVEAYAQAGKSIGQGLASIGQSVAQGIEGAEKKRKEEVATKAKLAPYIRNDQRIQVTEGLFKAGILTKAPDGTAVVSADYVGKVDMAALEKNLSFYNQTGGDGSKLSGDALLEFTARLESEQKYVADQAAKVKAGLDLDLQRAQIDELKSKAAERLRDSGSYAGIISSLLSGEPAPSSTLPTITLPDGTSGTVSQGVPVSKADTAQPGVAAPAAAPAAAAAPALSPALTAGTGGTPAAASTATQPAPAVSAALTAGTAGTPAAPAAAASAAPAPAAAEPEVKTWADAAKIVGEEEQMARYRGERLAGMTPAEYVANWKESQAAKNAPEPAKDEIDTLAAEAGMTRDELLEASRISGVTPQEHINNLRAVAKAAAAPAEQAAPPAKEAPLEQRATPAGTPIPETYDVQAKAAEVEEKMKAIEGRRTEVRTKYAGKRTALEGQIATANRNLKMVLPSNKKGMEMAQASAAYHEGRRKSIDDAEARDLKAIDSEADAIKTSFTNYQAAATAARQGRTEDRLGRAEVREIKRDEAALTKEESETVRRIVKGYPMISVFTYQGYGMKDPKTGKLVDPALTAGIQEMPGERYTEASEQIKGYNSAQDFLLNMKATLRERENATGNRAKELGQRFLLTASNMENYFKAELASVFGVAAFRKPIVSGGNFSDADREFVRQAITYLNTANPSMSNKDLESSLKALSFMINGLYQSQIEGLGMTYNPEAAKARATALTSGGDKVGAGTIQKQVERTDRFYKSFNLNQGPASSISRAQIDAARSELQRTLRFEFSPDKARKDNEAALKASTK